MEKWRLLKLGETDAYTSATLPEVLGIAKNRGMIGNTLALYRPTSYVLVGPKTSLSQVNVSYCKEADIPIVRTIMRGGVGLMGDSCFYTLVLDRGESPSIDVVSNVFIQCIVEACQIFGLSTSRRPNSNDVLVGEKKVLGTSIRSFNDTLLLNGTLALDFDYDLAKETLIIPASKFKNKTAKSVEEWVTTVKKELDREVSFEEAEAALIQGFESVLQVKFEVVNSFSEAEKQILESLGEKYHSEEWTKYGKWSPVKEY